MAQTLQAQLIAKFEADGWRVTGQPMAHKCIVMTKPGRTDRYYFGPAGSLRRGGNRTTSVAVFRSTDDVRAFLARH